MRLHWTADPDKNIYAIPLAQEIAEKWLSLKGDEKVEYERQVLADPKTPKQARWYIQTRKGKSDKDWEQEMEINFSISEGQPVFPNFIYDTHIIPDLRADPTAKHAILVGIDAGFRHPAISVNQYDGKYLRTIGEWTPMNIRTEQLIREMKYQMSYFDPTVFKIRYYCGHEGRQVDADSGKNLLDWFDFFDLDLEVAEMRDVERGLDLMRTLLDIGRWKISGNCSRLIDGLSGSYVYPDSQVSLQNVNRNPVKDGVHDDIMDAIRAVVTMNFELDGRYMFTEREESLIAAGLATTQEGRIIRSEIAEGHPQPICGRTGY